MPSVPDPDGILIPLGQRIRIQIVNPDPNPGRPEFSQKNKLIKGFLFEEPERPL
jgi:hypothetical protein